MEYLLRDYRCFDSLIPISRLQRRDSIKVNLINLFAGAEHPVMYAAKAGEQNILLKSNDTSENHEEQDEIHFNTPASSVADDEDLAQRDKPNRRKDRGDYTQVVGT